MILSLLLVVAGAPVALGQERIVHVEPIAGLHALPQQCEEFLEAFRSAVREADLPSERRGASGWIPGEPFRRRVAIEEGAASGATWAVQISLGLPARGWGRNEYRQEGTGPAYTVYPTRVGGGYPKGRRASRGMVVSILVRSPLDAAASLGAEPDRISLVFPAASSPAADGDPVPAAMGLPWGDAGRAVGRLVLESVHRRTRDLGPDERLSLAPAVRVESAQ